MSDIEKIKQRIAKLLRMAEDASSPNEAAIAASRARKLMDSYQLDSTDIDMAFDEPMGQADWNRPFAAVPSYLGPFSIAVAKYNDCVVIYEGRPVTYKKKDNDRKRWGHQFVFQGYKTDVELACQMATALSDAVDRLTKEWWRANYTGKYNVRLGGEFKHHAFLAIRIRLEKLNVERDKITTKFEESKGQSLMVIKSKAVAEHFGHDGYKTKNSHYGHFDSNDEDAMAAAREGFKAGNAIKIGVDIEHEKPQAKVLQIGL